MRLLRITCSGQIRTGMHVRCVLDGVVIPDAKWYVPRSRDIFYLCQNQVGGTHCGQENIQGYTYSFSLSVTSLVNSGGILRGHRRILKEGETL